MSISDLQNFDFLIPESYQGTLVTIYLREQIPSAALCVQIPPKAQYLTVNPLEEEDEHQGDQGASDHIQLDFHNAREQYISTETLEHKIVTRELMGHLENIFTPLY